MGRLTTHVLDTVHGTPAAGIAIDLYKLNGDERTHIKSIVTNADGRCDAPVLTEEELNQGQWELVFHVGEYFSGRADETSASGFLDLVPVRFYIQDRSADYHVPLLASPWSYTTYRGS